MEKPDDPRYYPKYHEVYVVPYPQRVREYGPNWAKDTRRLAAEVESRLADWIRNSGIPHDVVFDLHDNTPLPEYAQMSDRIAREENFGYMTKTGRLAVYDYREIHFAEIDFRFKTNQFDEMMMTYKPKSRLPTKIEKDIYEREFPALSEYEIGFEFHPEVIFYRKNGSEFVRRYTIDDGISVVTQLISHIRRKS